MITALEQLELTEAEGLMGQEEKFKLKDLGGANWALRKIAAYKKKQTQIKELAAEELYRINCWQDRELDSIYKSIEYFEGLLAEYLIEQRQTDPKFKISTPYGKVSTRKQQPKWEYQDEIVLEYLKSIEMKELIRVKEELNKADLKKTVTVEGNKVILQGVELPGISILEQPDKVVVSVEV